MVFTISLGWGADQMWCNFWKCSITVIELIYDIIINKCVLVFMYI